MILPEPNDLGQNGSTVPCGRQVVGIYLAQFANARGRAVGLDNQTDGLAYTPDAAHRVDAFYVAEDSGQVVRVIHAAGADLCRMCFTWGYLRRLAEDVRRRHALPDFIKLRTDSRVHFAVIRRDQAASALHGAVGDDLKLTHLAQLPE